MKKILLTIALLSVFMFNSNAQQIENGSFEDGTYQSTYGTADPIGYGTLNFDQFGLPQTTTLSTTDPFHSATNVVLTTRDGHAGVLGVGNDTLPGILWPQDLYAGSAENDAHSERLQSVMFHYKCNNINQDSSYAYFELSDDAGNTVAELFQTFGGTVNNWTMVNLMFDYYSADDVDSLFLQFGSSGGGSAMAEPGSILEIDAIVYCKEFLIDFDTTITDRTVDLTAMTSATGNGGTGTVSWDFGDGNVSTDMNPTHEYMSNGTYIISLSVVDSCGNDSTFTKEVLIDSDLAVGALINPANLSIYPNPASDQVNIKFSMKEEKEVNIDILDLTGRVVTNAYNKTTASDNVLVNTADLNAGNYMVVITSKDGLRQVEKLVIK